jgi:exodeoxyribonuclease III
VRDAYSRLVAQGWPTRCGRFIRARGSLPSGNYFRNAFARDAGLRVDHLLLSPSLAGRLVAAGVDREVRAREHASDHAPVWIELADAKTGSRQRGRRPRMD